MLRLVVGRPTFGAEITRSKSCITILQAARKDTDLLQPSSQSFNRQSQSQWPSQWPSASQSPSQSQSHAALTLHAALRPSPIILSQSQSQSQSSNAFDACSLQRRSAVRQRRNAKSVGCIIPLPVNTFLPSSLL